MLIAFISGHLDLTEEEFQTHYKPEIEKFHLQGAGFLVGDARGADILIQKFLKEIDAKTVVYHMLGGARFNAGFSTVGGFTSDKQRDVAMTQASNLDIGWVRPGKEKSGTADNLKRRHLHKHLFLHLPVPVPKPPAKKPKPKAKPVPAKVEPTKVLNGNYLKPGHYVLKAGKLLSVALPVNRPKVSLVKKEPEAIGPVVPLRPKKQKE